jgi:amidase
VAARLAPLAVGTETDGSIVCPAGVNGIVGIKPTVGTISRHGIIPISHTQDTAGPMGLTVTDAALLLAAMVGHDPQDPGARPFPGEAPAFLPEASRTRLDGLRIGVNRNYYGAGNYPAIEAVYQRALSTLESLGAVLVEGLDVDLPDELFEAELDVMLYEFKAGLNDYLASHPVPQDRNTLAGLIVWNQANADRVMPIFGQELFIRAEAKGGLEDDAYRAALEKGPLRMRAIAGAVLTEHDLDALVTLANSFAWKTDWVAGDRFMVGSSSLAAMSGFPSVTVPAGDVSGLPVGIAFVGEAFAEPRLIQIAYAFEQATRARLEPAFVPSLEEVR